MRTWLRSGTAILLWAVVGLAQAEVVNSSHIVLTIGDSTVLNLQGGGPNVPAQGSGSRTQGGVTANLAVDVNRYTAASINLTGSGNANAHVQGGSSFGFHLAPPAGANVKAGKLMLRVVLTGSASGNADVHLVTSVQSDFGSGSGNATISEGATHAVEFDVAVPIAPFVDDLSLAPGRIHMALVVTATVTPGNTAYAEATTETRVTGFRVLNSAGTQVSGFTLIADGGNLPELAASGPPPGIARLTAVEFHHAAFGHYFVSADAGEIAKLDAGTFAGWARTGQSFSVYSGTASGLVPVCRFFTVAFPPSSSHFYAPRGLGCEGTLANDKWTYEGDVFHVAVPDAAGTCPAAFVPVYRLYNNGRGGAPNHRFTTSEATRQAMLSQGYIAEGAGIGVGFCAPA